MGRLAANRVATVDRLTGAARRADRLAAAARKALDQQKKLAARQKRERDAVNVRLREVEGLLATLSEEQIAQLAGLEQKGVDRAQSELVASGALSATRPATRQGGDAVAYAIRQIGKPYVWGAEGPDSFDCSGLTSQAWSAAGRTIPRTSQEQWKRLPRVPLSALRPGDLVVYFPKATHVALYIGDGLVVQAPRPGTKVKVSPLAANPLLGPSAPTRAPPRSPRTPARTSPRAPARARTPATARTPPRPPRNTGRPGPEAGPGRLRSTASPASAPAPAPKRPRRPDRRCGSGRRGGGGAALGPAAGAVPGGQPPETEAR